MLVFGAGDAVLRPQAMVGSERLVADLLRGLDRSGSLAIYSTALRKARGKREAEADFIVLWDGAVLVLEVKGGSVGRDADGGWWLSSPGHGRRSIEPPMEQAKVEMYALRDLLLEIDGNDLRDSMAYGVVTPFTDPPPESVGWHSSQWIGRGSMTAHRLAVALDTLAAEARRRLSLESAELLMLRERLTQEFLGVADYRAEHNAVRHEQDRLTAEQARFFLGMGGVPRSLILGGAGTGKSIALAMAARQHSLAGRSVLLTFRSPALQSLFEQQLPGSQVEVLPLERLHAARSDFDVLLVDEAQDLMNEADLAVIFAKVRGGYAGGEWALALDPNNQAHIDGSFCSGTFERIAQAHPRFSLSLNVRNTRSMVEAVQANLRADIGAPTIAQGRAVRWEDVEAHADVDVRLERVVAKLEASIDPASPDSVAVISVAGVAQREPEALADGTARIGRVQCLSAQMAKGLEFDHVVVVDVPSAPSQAELAGTYVAMTRARVSMSVMLSPGARAWMRQNAMEMLRMHKSEVMK